MSDRPGPRLLASFGAAVAATSLAAALVLVIRRMQVSFDTSGGASIAAMLAGIVLVVLVDAASTGAATAARTLQRRAVRLGLALTGAGTLPAPSALVAPHARPLWLVAKFLFVVLLTWFHHWSVVLSKRFAAGERPVTEKRLRLMNEIPSLVTLAVAVLVIVKPF